MPPRKKVVNGILAGVDENHWSKPSTDHISMHSEGAESSGGTAHHESRLMMATIKDLQRSQAAMWAEFESLCQETVVPYAPQGPQGSLYLTMEDIHVILFEAKKMELFMLTPGLLILKK
nr:hypothetical protein CFP56_18197 [Quercus suber]